MSQGTDGAEDSGKGHRLQKEVKGRKKEKGRTGQPGPIYIIEEKEN